MIYPESFEAKTGFTTVREAVASLCYTEEGRRSVAEMSFTTDYGLVCRRLESVAEMLSIVKESDSLALGKVRDTGRLVMQVRVPGTRLSAPELASLRSSLEASADIARYFSARRDEAGKAIYPLLEALASRMEPFPALLQAIDGAIDRHGNIKDSASPELREIRRSMSSLQASLGSIMRRVMQRAAAEGLLEADASPAMRDGRLVMPVSPMHKRKVPGIVHDESASGKTVFIEPAEMVESNNRLRQLELDEHRETTRILTAIADILRSDIDRLLDTMETLGEIDFIHAKAGYAAQTDASLPSLDEHPGIEWYGACHPGLLASMRRQGKRVVPLDIMLTPKSRILVISGPNAGGKSVAIKTVAIVQYMTQCGLLPPLYDNSRMGMFDDIMIDIGDDQSIENDLSTYSSHLRNMKEMLRHGRKSSLFIVDEMGSGTEPLIGGALAQTILSSFNEKGMWGVVTTHYQNLKTFAEETPGLVNGSMLYDRQLMAPLFKLSIGVAGSSFAIEIARKTGLPPEIIGRAEEIAGSDYINLDRYLLDIARDKRYWENKRTAIRQKEKKIDETLERYESSADELRRQRREIIADAKRQAEELLHQSNASIERTIHDIKRAQAEKEKTREARRQISDLNTRLSELDAADRAAGHPLLQRVPKKPRREQPRPAAIREITAGDVVRLDGRGTPGRVVEISGAKATVVFGMLKTTVDVKRLQPTDAKIPSSTDRPTGATTTGAGRDRQLSMSREIDLRGMRVDEALQAVTYFIDDAIRFNAVRVRLLHGTGTGALREAIRQQLAATPGIARFADEDVRLGGAGITVVDLL